MTADEARAELAIAALAWGATRDDKRLLAAIDAYYDVVAPIVAEAALADVVHSAPRKTARVVIDLRDDEVA